MRATAFEVKPVIVKTKKMGAFGNSAYHPALNQETIQEKVNEDSSAGEKGGRLQRESPREIGRQRRRYRERENVDESVR
ncbi:hypothetical protein [Caballeronia novacaledonica]|uniref:Uncharacterized protein n=1 Tax=Caballeronia novacaledonica TaxID=1544861 RepID=A0AA37ID57_9BURK|nr:hypothetical protein [Caballeronia novacaledonica]GJH27064.1 hypothetical protein CBA19CS42_21130 [Caballeronia novacaledonica]